MRAGSRSGWRAPAHIRMRMPPAQYLVLHGDREGGMVEFRPPLRANGTGRPITRDQRLDVGTRACSPGGGSRREDDGPPSVPA